MPAKLTEALKFANYRTTLNNQKAILKEKAQNLLSYNINGGTFTIDRELISFCYIMKEKVKNKDVVLLDIYDHPIKVDIKNFYEEIVSRYTEATNKYHVEYEKLRKARKVESVVDLNNE